MESIESPQKSKKRKATENNLSEVDSKKPHVEHYERRIESLVLNNDALTHALDASHKTICHQDKLISNLQMKLVSQFPKLIELRLEAMGKIIQQLIVMFEETKTLLNNETSAMNSISLPSSNSSLVTDEVPDKQKETVNETKMPLTPIPNHSSETPSSSKATSKTTTTVLPSIEKNDTAKVKSGSKAPEEHNDEFINLPASTSKVTPRLSRQRTSTLKSSKISPAPKVAASKRRVERCKKVDTYKPLSSSDENDDDDEPLDVKKKRLKIKFQPKVKVPEKSKFKNDESSTSDTKGKKTMNSNNADNSIEVLEAVDAKKTPPSSSVTETESISLASNTILKESNETEITPSKPPPPLPNSKSSKKKQISSKSASGKKESSRRSNIKSSEKIKSRKDNTCEEEEKINGTISKKSNKSRKDSHFESLFNSVLKEPEVKVNREKASPKTKMDNWSQETSIDLINNQPQVVLMDIFTTSQNTADPLISKSREEFFSLNKLEHKSEDGPSIENSKGLLPDLDITDLAKPSDDAPPLDLELECMAQDDHAVPSSSTKETSLILNKTDANSVLGLNENSSVSPGFGFFQDKDNSSDKSIDNEINLDTIDQLLANVCDDSFNKDFEREDKLVFTYS